MFATLFYTPVRAGGLPRTSNRHARRHARSISCSANNQKALPFSLKSNANTVVHATKDESQDGRRLRMIMFGKPGAGKGTLSSRLVKKYDIVSISTGDLLRQHIAKKTEEGRQAEEIVAKGDLLPDEFMLRVVAAKLDQLRDKHWILDGFPRTIGQGELLDAHLRTTNTPLTLLVNLIIPNAILRARIADRWVHAPSGRVYNLSFNPPRIPGRDDLTGEPLIQRPDDRPDVFERRLVAYERETAPLLGYYAARAEGAKGGGAMGGAGAGGLRVVPLEGETSDEIWPVLERTVCELFPGVRTREEVERMEEQAQARRRGEPIVSRRDLEAAEAKAREGGAKATAGAPLAE